MKKLIMIMSFLMLAVIITTGSALAIPVNLAIDFRDNPWFNGKPGNTGSSSMTHGSITVTPNGGTLSAYADDGFGVWGGENDEINKDESLSVIIKDGMWLSGAWLTDLFYSDSNYQGTNGAENGWVLLNGENRFNFSASADQINGSTNGEYFIDFGQSILVTSADFLINDEIGNEYSVAGFAAPVPEPASMLLLGTGLVGLVGFVRKRK